MRNVGVVLGSVMVTAGLVWSQANQAAPPVPIRIIELPPPPPDPNDFKVSSDVELVLLDVSVKDVKGGFASGLQRSDFEIFEDNKLQKISVFASQDIPVTVGLVIDNSGSVRAKRSDIVTAALTLVGASHPQDEVFVLNFNDRVRFGLPPHISFTDDRALLRNALLINPAEGRTSLYDGIKTAVEHLEKGRKDKKTLVVVSDGGDNASECTREELMRLVESSQATIYTVGIFDNSAKDKNPGFLRDLAHVTGGEAFVPDKMDQLITVCEKIAKDIRNRYTIGYAPENLTRDGKSRKLRVRAVAPDKRKLVVRTRTHYIAQIDPRIDK